MICRKIAIILMAIKLFVDNSFSKSNYLDLFIKIFILKDVTINAKVVAEEYHIENFSTWKKKMNEKIDLLEMKIKEIYYRSIR